MGEVTLLLPLVHAEQGDVAGEVAFAGVVERLVLGVAVDRPLEVTLEEQHAGLAALVADLADVHLDPLAEGLAEELGLEVDGHRRLGPVAVLAGVEHGVDPGVLGALLVGTDDGSLEHGMTSLQHSGQPGVVASLWAILTS